MHYYQFNIGDYMRDTAHLDEMEDLAYRRMLDLYYLRESPLPKDVKEVAKLIRMRMHTECIASVLQEYFTLTDKGYINDKADEVLAVIYDKSEKAKIAAEKRWELQRLKNANALQAQSECNADGMLPNTHNPIPNTEVKDIGDSVESPKNKKQTTLDFSGWPKQADAEILKAWLSMRKRVKASCSQLAMNTIGNELHKAVDAGWSVDECLRQAEAASWKGFKASWMKREDQRNGYQNGAGLNRHEKLQQWSIDTTARLEQQLAELQQQEDAAAGHVGEQDFIPYIPDVDS